MLLLLLLCVCTCVCTSCMQIVKDAQDAMSKASEQHEGAKQKITQEQKEASVQFTR